MYSTSRMPTILWPVHIKTEFKKGKRIANKRTSMENKNL